jgi:hypothetical protein
MFDHVRAADWIRMLCNSLLMLMVAFFPSRRRCWPRHSGMVLASARPSSSTVPLYLAGTLVGAVLPVLGLAIFAAPAIFFWLPLGQGEAGPDSPLETAAPSTPAGGESP